MLDKIHKITNNIIFKGLKTNNSPKWVQNSFDVLDNLKENTEQNLINYKNNDLDIINNTSDFVKKTIADTITDSIIDGIITLSPKPVSCGLNLISIAKDELTEIRDETKIRFDYIINTVKELAERGDPKENHIRADMVFKNAPFMVGHLVVSAGAYIGETLSEIKDYISEKLVNVFDTYKEILTSKLDVVKDYVFGFKPHIENIMSKFQNPRDITNYKEKDIIDVFKSSCVLPTGQSKSCMTDMKNLDIMFHHDGDAKRRQTIQNTKNRWTTRKNGNS